MHSTRAMLWLLLANQMVRHELHDRNVAQIPEVAVSGGGFKVLVLDAPICQQLVKVAGQFDGYDQSWLP